MIRYIVPYEWINYDVTALTTELVGAKAAVLSLQSIPYQKDWVDSLQQMELKREVAGTSKIEGADFTEGELDAAMKDAPEDLVTRSQRQAHAAMGTYRWIATVDDDRPIDAELVCEIHRNIVTGADDDRCPPGIIRSRDQNVSFGRPLHRGAEGGEECSEAFSKFVEALNSEYLGHDPLIRALAAHYHFAAMHPFL
ncbi:MAG: Fic family protein, partial [bacterium]